MDTVDHYKDCKHNCAKNPLCKRWTYGSGSSTGDCYLKKNTDGPIHSCKGCMMGFTNSNLVKCSEQGMDIIFQTSHINQTT